MNGSFDLIHLKKNCFNIETFSSFYHKDDNKKNEIQ